MMFDRNHAQSSWRSVAVLERSDRIRSLHFILALVLAFLLSACTSYYEEFEDEYGYGKSSKGYKIDGTTLTDLRDEHTYNVAKVGNLYWMLDNVAYKFYRNHDEEDKADCPRPSETTCKNTGFLYPGTKLDYVCPNGWRLPSYEEWEEFSNSSAFRNYSLDNDVYKGYMSGDRSLNKDGEAAYFWTNDEEDGNHYRKCVSFTPESGSFQIAGPCHEQWKLAVRCVLDAGSAGPEQNIDDVSSLEVNLEEVCAMGLNEQCLVGTWNLKGIESLDKSQTYTDFTSAPTVLEFTKDGNNRSFSVTFTNNSILSPMAADGCGGTKTYGKWEISGESLTLTIGRADCGAPSKPNYIITPSLSVTDLYLNKVVFHENDMTDALTKANGMEHFVRVYHPTSNITSVSEEVVSCQHPAYCYTTTADSQRHCDLDNAVAEVKVQQAKDEGIFKEYFVDCWDL